VFSLSVTNQTELGKMMGLLVSLFSHAFLIMQVWVGSIVDPPVKAMSKRARALWAIVAATQVGAPQAVEK